MSAIDDFLSGVGPWRDSISTIQRQVVLYSAGEKWKIGFVRIFLLPNSPADIPTLKISTKSLLALNEIVPVDTAAVDEFFNAFAVGEMEVAGIRVSIPKENVSYYPLGHPGFQFQAHREQVLMMRISDGDFYGVKHKAEFELRSLETPYDGVEDLYSEFGIADAAHDTEPRFELIANSPAVVA